MNEYGEPWTRVADDTLETAQGATVIGGPALSIPAPSMLDRIAACVNHCAGFSTDQLGQDQPYVTDVHPPCDATTTGDVSWRPMARKPTWRKEPPDKPGWWWMRCHDGGASYVVEIGYRNEDLCVLDDRLDPLVSSVSKAWLWSGPIEPPEPL